MGSWYQNESGMDHSEPGMNSSGNVPRASLAFMEIKNIVAASFGEVFVIILFFGWCFLEPNS